MIVSDIYQEVREMTGSAQEAVNFRALTRGIEVLANKRLCDPLLGYLDLYVPENSYTIALPREVKTPLRINLNNNPAFPRDRLFEFTMNTDGTVEGEEIGWSWSNRLHVPVQDETQFPGKLKYVHDRVEDNGKTAMIKGRDIEGVERTETLIGATSGAVESTYEYLSLTSVRREATVGESYLSVEDVVIARYDADESFPNYRAIKLSKAAVAVRVLFRRKVFQIASQNDELPISSAAAILQGIKAWRLFSQEKWEEGNQAIERAKEFLNDEQDTLESAHQMSDVLDSATATDTNISTRDGVIVADIYDDAAEIFGPVGRRKLFDKITHTIEALVNAKNWESQIGWCDIWRMENTTEINPQGSAGNGLFVLPRDVESILQLNAGGRPARPRNGWHEFHLNGTGERNTAPIRTWQDEGETVIIARLPIDEDTRRVTPSYVVAVPDQPIDNDTAVKVYGIEELADGTQVEVYRDGSPGWTCPCTYGSYNPGNNAPRFVRIDRVTKAASTGFIRFLIVTRGTEEAMGTVDNPDSGVFELIYTGTARAELEQEIIVGGVIYEVTAIAGMVPDVRDMITIEPIATLTDGAIVYVASEDFTASTLLGYWYPDEVEPKYQIIKTSSTSEQRIRVKFRRRWRKVGSLYDWIPLRSRLAIANMMRAIVLQKTDPSAAAQFEGAAIKLLSEELRASRPHNQGSLQIDSGSWPGFSGNIQ